MLATPLMRLLLTAAAIAVVALAAMTGFERYAAHERAAERRALLHRHLDLDRSAITSGSALTCLNGAAGDAVEQACEKAIFASAPAVAAAVSYTGLRLTLLAEAVAFAGQSEAAFLTAFAASRRAIELDRFGLAAHVLALRDGCTPERCDGFALVRDSGVLKANLRNRVFDQYVSRHADGWSAPAAREAAPQVSQSRDAAPPAVALAEPPAIARAATGQNNVPRTVIPPVSIMDSEPQLTASTGEAAAAGAAAAPAATGTPLPPRRPAPAVRPPE